MSKVDRLNAAGDPVNLAFIGVYFYEDEPRINVYLRCHIFSKKILLEAKVDRYIKLGRAISQEQKDELADLLIQAQLQKENNYFIAGDMDNPQTRLDVITFTKSPVGNDIQMETSPMHASYSPLLIRFFAALHIQTNPYKNWEIFSAAVLSSIDGKVVRKIAELDDKQAQGVYI